MFKYDPAKISSRELPIWGRAGNLKWRHDTALKLCLALQSVPEELRYSYDFSAEEWKNISVVANGGIWPVPEEIYTYDDWVRDRELSAIPGQEIAKVIYEAMLNVLPPLRLPRNERTSEYEGGFLVSEPDSGDPCGKGVLYAGYGRKGEHYYYIGLIPCKKYY